MKECNLVGLDSNVWKPLVADPDGDFHLVSEMSALFWIVNDTVLSGMAGDMVPIMCTIHSEPEMEELALLEAEVPLEQLVGQLGLRTETTITMSWNQMIDSSETSHLDIACGVLEWVVSNLSGSRYVISWEDDMEEYVVRLFRDKVTEYPFAEFAIPRAVVKKLIKEA